MKYLIAVVIVACLAFPVSAANKSKKVEVLSLINKCAYALQAEDMKIYSDENAGVDEKNSQLGTNRGRMYLVMMMLYLGDDDVALMALRRCAEQG